MTTSEPGPELDRRVVELLGWQVSEQVRSAKGGMLDVWSHPRNGRHFPGEIPTYSTDPARIAEMVEWLTERTGSGIEHGVNIDWKGSDYPEGAFVQQNGLGPFSTGKTIQHALAMLVVAVGDE